MPTDLPGKQVDDNLPPLAQPGGGRATVPASWDDINLVAAAVFDVLKREGKPAADALLAWIKDRRAAK